MSNARRLVAKSLAVIYGLLGLFWFFISLIPVPVAIAQKEYFVSVMALLMAALGAVFLIIAYQVVFRYSEKSRKNLCFLIGLTLFFVSSDLLQPTADRMLDIKEAGAHSFRMIMGITLGLLPVLIGIVTYKAARRFFEKE